MRRQNFEGRNWPVNIAVGHYGSGDEGTLFDVDGDADYYQVGALIGFGWK